MIVALSFELRHPLAIAVGGLAAVSLVAVLGATWIDAQRHGPSRWAGLLPALRHGRRQYAGFLIHLGFVGLAIGVVGSSLGSDREQVVMRERETVQWAGLSIRLQRMRQRIMHKFNYFIKSHGRTACVGCCRCVTYCPVNLDIRKVIKEIRDQKSGVIDQNSGVGSEESE